jgi:hypothetical protein
MRRDEGNHNSLRGIRAWARKQKWKFNSMLNFKFHCNLSGDITSTSGGRISLSVVATQGHSRRKARLNVNSSSSGQWRNELP